MAEGAVGTHAARVAATESAAGTAHASGSAAESSATTEATHAAAVLGAGAAAGKHPADNGQQNNLCGELIHLPNYMPCWPIRKLLIFLLRTSATKTR
ncbi:MAG TPA: hypothetical protein VGJ04_10895 [Pirellulales bacterium]